MTENRPEWRWQYGKAHTGSREGGQHHPKAIHELGTKQEREFYQHWVLWHWADIVGKAYAQNVKAVRIEREVLYVAAAIQLGAMRRATRCPASSRRSTTTRAAR